MADAAAGGMPGTLLDAGDEDTSSESVAECDAPHGSPGNGSAKDANAECGSFDTPTSATFEAALRLVQDHLKNLADVHRREVSLLQLKSKKLRTRFNDCAEPGHDKAGEERADRGAGKEEPAPPTARREAEAHTLGRSHGGDPTSSSSSVDEEVKKITSLRGPVSGGNRGGNEPCLTVTPNRGLASRKIHFGGRAKAAVGAAGQRQGILVKDSSRRPSVAGSGTSSAIGSFAGSGVGSASTDSDTPSNSEEEVWNYHSGDSSGSEAEAGGKGGGCAGSRQKCPRRSVKFNSEDDFRALYSEASQATDPPGAEVLVKAAAHPMRLRSFSQPNLTDLESKGRRKLSFHPFGVFQSIRDLADGRAGLTPVVPLSTAATGGAPGALAGGQQRATERRRISIPKLRISVDSEKSAHSQESHVSVEEARDKVMEALQRRRSLGFSVVMAKHGGQQAEDGGYSTAPLDDKKTLAETQNEHATVAQKRGEAPERDARKFSVTSMLSVHSCISRGTTASRLGLRKCRFAAGDNLELRPPWDITDDSLCVELLPLFSVTASIISDVPMGRRDSNSSARTLNSVGPPSGSQRNTRRWPVATRTILHPQSRPRLLFDIIGMLFLGYDIVMTPVLLCFPMHRAVLWTLMDWATVIFWTLDMGAAFCTAFHASDGSLVCDRCRIARNYLRTWLCFDMVIVVPDWMLLLTDSNSIVEALGAMKIIRFIRILRLLRLVKLDKLVRDMQARINSNYFLLTLGILRLTTMLSITIHFIACIWYVLGSHQDDGWIAVEGLGETRIIYLYLVSLQWSITQFQGGSSMVQPGDTSEVLFAVITMMLALITYSSLLSSITHMMWQLSSLREERTKQMRALFGFLDDYHISAELSVRVKKYMESYKSQQQKEEQVTLLALLPKPILMDLHNEAHGPIITMHDFFNHCNTNHPRVTRHLCHEALQQVSFQHADTVFATGDACNRMFFVECGTLTYKFAGHHNRRSPSMAGMGSGMGSSLLHPHSNIATSSSDIMSPTDRGVRLAKGQWIAEAALWTRWENCGDLVANTNCNLLALDASNFAEVTERYDGAFAECVLYARAFVEGINICRRLTDLPDFQVINSTANGHVDLS